MELSRSFRLPRGSSLKLGRSNRSLIVSESISSESARFTSYERLSESMRLSGTDNKYNHGCRKSRSAWGFFNKIFSSKKIDGHDEVNKGQQLVVKDEEKKKKKTAKSSPSSWLPDPNRRWPVQGW